MNHPLEITDFSFMPLDKRMAREKRNKRSLKTALWGIALGIGLYLLFFGAFSAFANPIDKLVGVEGDAVHDNAWYCKNLHLYSLADEDKEAITSYCNNLTY